MKVFCVFINIVLLVTLLAESNPAHGSMHVTGINRNWYKKHHRIYGGNEVISIEQFPYMAFMTYWETDKDGNRKKIHGCGATILTPTYLLTAAHCVSTCAIRKKDLSFYCKENTKNTYQIYVGSVVGKSAYEIAKVKAFHVHPENQFFDPVLWRNRCANNHDLAIVELRRPLQFNSKICNVELPLSIRKANMNYGLASTNINTDNCKILGWGFTRIGEPRSNTTDEVLKRHLKVARVNVIDTQACLHYINITLPNVNVLCPSTQICTKDPQNIIGTCLGDSGGPIVCDGVQIGVTSFVTGDTCVGPISVQIYSRVDVSMKWIRTLISKEEEDFYGYVISGCRRNL